MSVGVRGGYTNYPRLVYNSGFWLDHLAVMPQGEIVPGNIDQILTTIDYMASGFPAKNDILRAYVNLGPIHLLLGIPLIKHSLDIRP